MLFLLPISPSFGRHSKKAKAKKDLPTKDKASLDERSYIQNDFKKIAAYVGFSSVIAGIRGAIFEGDPLSWQKVSSTRAVIGDSGGNCAVLQAGIGNSVAIRRPWRRPVDVIFSP